MRKEQFHIKAHYYLALLIAFSLPFAMLTPVVIALMLLNWLVEGDLKNKFKKIGNSKLALLFIGLFAMHLIGLIYTENMNSGLFDIQIKFSILLFPLIIASRPFDTKKTKTIFYAFFVGCILSSLSMITRAIYTYEILGENNFFYNSFSFLIHPSYFSMYLNFAISSLIIIIYFNKDDSSKFLFWFSVFAIIYFSFIVVLLSSKLGLITLILQFIGFLIYYIFKSEKYVMGIAGILFIMIAAFSIVHFVPAIGNRVDNATQALTNRTSNQTDVESTAVRLLIWKAANQVISENTLWGTGTGDSKEVLVKEYEKRGMTGALENKLNTHNEFYQVFVTLGLIGFIILLANLFLPLGFAFKTSNTIYIVFLFIIILNFLTESMFETQAGVMFYAFFNSLLCFNKEQNN